MCIHPDLPQSCACGTAAACPALQTACLWELRVEEEKTHGGGSTGAGLVWRHQASAGHHGSGGLTGRVPGKALGGWPAAADRESCKAGGIIQLCGTSRRPNGARPLITAGALARLAQRRTRGERAQAWLSQRARTSALVCSRCPAGVQPPHKDGRGCCSCAPPMLRPTAAHPQRERCTHASHAIYS